MRRARRSDGHARRAAESRRVSECTSWIRCAQRRRHPTQRRSQRRESGTGRSCWCQSGCTRKGEREGPSILERSIARRRALMNGFRTTWWLLGLFVLLLSGPLLTLAFGSVSMRGDWRTATHRATGLTPDPATHPEAVVQVYASRTFGWRGAFAVHTWLAAKPAGAERYTRYEVIGWYAMRGGSALSISDHGTPDAEWYGAPPRLVRDVRGAKAQ